MKRLAIFALDNVIYEGQSQGTVLSVLRAERLLGVLDHVAISALFAAYCAGFCRPETVRRSAFRRLAGLKASILDAAIDRHIGSFAEPLRRQARALVEKHRAPGDEL